MQIDQITSIQAFDALEQDWRRLERLSSRNSLFLGWDWQRLWWHYYGTGRQLRILVARLSGRVVGIFPLYLETHRVFKLLRVRKLRPIGAGGDTAPDDLGMVFDPAYERAVAQAFVDHVMDAVPEWQLLDLVDLPSDSALAACWLAAAQRAPGRVGRTDGNAITYGDLPADWETYRGGLSRNRREVLGRKRRKFAQQDGARFYRADQIGPLDAAFDRLAALHLLRWQGRTDTPSFSTDAYLGFHRDLMHALQARGALRLYALDLRGQAVAMLYGFRHGDAFYYFQAGFDPAHAALSVGEVLMGYVIEATIDEGCRVFDMLKGDYGHKRHFFQQTRTTQGVRVHRPGLIHWLYRVKAWRESRRPAPQVAAPGQEMGDASASEPSTP